MGKRGIERAAALLNRRMSRRGLMVFTAGGAMFLTACGGDDGRRPAAQATATEPDDSASGTPSDGAAAAEDTSGGTDTAELQELRSQYDSRSFPDLPGWREGPKAGGILRLSSDAPPHWDVTSPIGGTLASFAPRHMNGLITFKKGDHADNHSLELEGDLADSWEQIDDVTYEFHINKDVYWHDLEPMNGRQLIASDIQYALEVYKSESSVIGPLLEVVDRFETPDDHTLRIVLQQPAAYFLRSLAQPPLVIFGKEAHESSEGLQSWPVGTGPFILTEQESRVGMKMEKNPKYFKKGVEGDALPYLDGIETVFLQDPATQLAAFRSGEIDFYSFWVETVDALYSVLESNPDTVVQVNPPAPTGQIHIGLRLDKEPWNNVNVRRALSLAINRDAIVEAVYKGVAVPSQPMDWSYFGSDWPYETGAPELGEYMQYDPERAKELLAEAGYGDGIRGTMPSQWQSGASLNVLELIQADWRKIGVDIEIETPEQTAFFEQLYSASWEDLIGLYFLTQGTDPDNFTYELMHSSSSKNIFHINDPKVDDLCEQQRTELDPDKRREIVQEIINIELDQVFRIWAVNPYKINIRQPTVFNVTDGLYAWISGWGCGVAERVWLNR